MADEYEVLGWVLDWGGGMVDVIVHRDLMDYPANGTPVYVKSLSAPKEGTDG